MTPNKYCSSVLFFFLISGILFSQSLDSLYSEKRFNKEQYVMTQKVPKEAYTYFNEGAIYFKKKRDIANYLICINYLSDIEHRKGHFNKAFDLIWESLPLAHSIENKRPLYKFHQMLGILYGAFGKDSIALTHAKEGLKIAKEHVLKNKESSSSIISSYLDVAVQYVEMQTYKNALNYLDSCYIAQGNNNRLLFVDGVYAITYLKLGNIEKSKTYFRNVLPYLEKQNNGFQTSISFHIAELKDELKQNDSAIYYYKKSLKAIDSLEYNIKLKPKVLEALADTYSKTNQNFEAYKSMQAAKSISDSLFHAQSELNKHLFEIKNNYKEALKKKEEQLIAQNKILTANKSASSRLKLLIGALLLFIVISLIAIKQRNKMKQMAYTREKNNAILELKNKELTANALQIIEKETSVKELLKSIEEENPKKFKILSRKHKQSNKKLWDDFHLRFTQINNTFYDKLLELHPDLTATDLKHCALIKLNFDSKEMSHLLGISINSVHMARSRIRKKLNLKRNENLTSYLALVN
ncbi:helix-turn-helix transcriptional regulator [Seonamhaeicola maritimus]|uniref:Tetratricopeptide repeat protein n=1 Tax=Seonamhaeicola maritimus TaxID=2591822 RepID=A0A5C7GN18_9FLAO|nr:hypothetical protein [Seonamhaeicola maritimus]TXG39477.1 hypothetical protein FUA22_06295 [Seonamhaeicola maritimus]